MRELAFLRLHLFSVGGYRVFVYTILQHASTVIGIVILAWWMLRRSETAELQGATVHLTSSEGTVAVLLLAAIPVVSGMASLFSNLSLPLSGAILQMAVGRAVISAFFGLAVGTLAFSVWWHLGPARAGSRTAIPTDVRAARK